MSDTAATVVIRGATVDRRFVYIHIAWVVAVLCFWPFTIVGCRRAYRGYKRSNGRLREPVVGWVHNAIMVFFMTIVAIDPTGIIFDLSGAVNLVCLLGLILTHYSSAIYSFVGSVQRYILQQKLTEPPWVDKFRRTFLWFNFIVGSIMLIIQVAVDRVAISGLMLVFVSLEGAVIGPIMVVLVRKLTRRLEDQFSTVSSAESLQSERRLEILRGVRKFRRFTYLALSLMYFLVSLVSLVYVPRMFVPWEVLHSNSAEYPDFARHRRFKETFKLNWVMFVGLATSIYFPYRHWIAKSSFAGKLSQEKSTNSMDSTTMSRGDKRSYNEETTTAPSRASRASIWGPPPPPVDRKFSVASSDLPSPRRSPTAGMKRASVTEQQAGAVALRMYSAPPTPSHRQQQQQHFDSHSPTATSRGSLPLQPGFALKVLPAPPNTFVQPQQPATPAHSGNSGNSGNPWRAPTTVPARERAHSSTADSADSVGAISSDVSGSSGSSGSSGGNVVSMGAYADASSSHRRLSNPAANTSALPDPARV